MRMRFPVGIRDDYIFSLCKDKSVGIEEFSIPALFISNIRIHLSLCKEVNSYLIGQLPDLLHKV